MKHVLTIFELHGINESENMPPAISMDFMIKDAQLLFNGVFPGGKIKVIWKNGHTQPVLDYMWQGQGWLVTARKAVLGITELSSPEAYAALKKLAAGEYSRLIDTARYESPRKFQLPGGVWVTFSQLKLGERRPDGTQAWEPVALFNVDDYKAVIEMLANDKRSSDELAASVPKHRRSSAPSFEKVMAGGFWEKIKKIRKLEDGTIDYGDSDLTSAEHKKFMRLRKEGVLKFVDGNVVRVEQTFECLVPTFADYLSLGS